ncbi:Protein kinase C iota type [Phytophthora ramorum]|uniref:Protein kinase C iota type n=1 Tax=Phytophthora ramorum TaxID=164328 RepID=UPI0030B1555F|nr:Protein kinase C iota type [Phytophthora ramorum]
MAAVLPAASLHVQTADPIPAAKKRPLSPTRLLDEVPEVSADDLKTPTARPPTSSSVSPKSVAISAINPHDLKLLKVIGRGTFARQVALARHCETQSIRLTAAQAMDHPFFKLSLNWDELFQRQVTPPIVPVCHGRDSTDNFDDDFTNAPVVSLKLQSGDFVKRVRLDDCSGPVTDSARADEFQDF